MGKLIHLRGDPHGETQALLPWYVTGRLDPADRLLVEAHLATCGECRAELAIERRLSATIRDLPMAVGDPWERFAARLPPRADRRRWWRRPVPVAGFAAAQAAVVLLCVGLVVTARNAAPAPAYHALGDAVAPRTGNMLVMFAPGTSKDRVRGAIGAARAMLIVGPTAAGAYVLAVAPGERGTALAMLRERSEVTLAEPIDAPKP